MHRQVLVGQRAGHAVHSLPCPCCFPHLLLKLVQLQLEQVIQLEGRVVHIEVHLGGGHQLLPVAVAHGRRAQVSHQRHGREEVLDCAVHTPEHVLIPNLQRRTGSKKRSIDVHDWRHSVKTLYCNQQYMQAGWTLLELAIIAVAEVEGGKEGRVMHASWLYLAISSNTRWDQNQADDVTCAAVAVQVKQEPQAAHAPPSC